jgi:hypothetical protein
MGQKGLVCVECWHGRDEHLAQICFASRSGLTFWLAAEPKIRRLEGIAEWDEETKLETKGGDAMWWVLLIEVDLGASVPRGALSGRRQRICAQVRASPRAGTDNEVVVCARVVARDDEPEPTNTCTEGSTLPHHVLVLQP